MNYLDKFDNKTFLITGATGFIGSLIVKKLCELRKNENCNIRIIAFVRNEEKARKMLGSEVELLIGDIRDEIKPPSDLDRLDYIIHCASITASKTMIDRPEETFKIGIEGTLNILRIAKLDKSESFVYLSSMEVYGETKEEDNPIREDKLGVLNADDPRSSYPLSKRKCEEMCKEYNREFGTHVKIARLAQIVGPGIPLTDNRISMQFARAVIDNRDIVLHTEGKSINNFCYTDDAIDGIFTILLMGSDGEAYNVCNDKESRTIYSIAELVSGKIANNNIEVKLDIPNKNIYGYPPTSLMRLNSDKLKALGWKANIDMETAYRNLIDYLKQY